ncbi:hypothetical protein TCAL_01081 [Tigriopus californicus]|uniref:Oxidation resistance protein 1 n=1 Tax=Tigriopus californicus TaxID=6832 RepID=A0A553P3G3_TIGCA|nr:hypothetical protein TCAL_01081 [Tigriopus californicus]|eukprot:TCALIF_01081-PA protein Name:"Similar to TLDC2 TLD domain-containing protein 2 (Bos taurus)" AED:0.31 eAED:0.78 QI:0/-1/0/1/-1/1/1/0/546
MEEKHVNLKHTISLPASFHGEPIQREPDNEDHKEGGLDKPSWSFGNMAKAVGSGVTAVGSGFVSGSKVVTSGVFQGSKAVGSGVALGTKAAGKVTKAAGKSVCHASELVGKTAVSGVSVIGTSTIQASRVVTSASVNVMQDTTKWMREQSNSFPEDENIHVVMPDETIDDIAERYNVTSFQLIRSNSLTKRKLRPGKVLTIIAPTCEVEPPTDEVEFAAILDGNKGKIVFETKRVIISTETGDLRRIPVEDLEKIGIRCRDDEPDEIPDLISVSSQFKYPPDHVDMDDMEQEGITVEVVTLESENSPGKITLNLEFHCNRNSLFPFGEFLRLWYPPDIVDQDFLEDEPPAFELKTQDSLFDTLDTSLILNGTLFQDLLQTVPACLQHGTVNLVYSTSRDGYSLKNLYRKVSLGEPPFILVIQDHQHRKFGAFATCPLMVTENFVGTGQSFLFKVRGGGDDDDVDESRSIKCSEWSKINDYFFKGQNDAMLFGADDGKFGIIIDSNLYRGRLEKCGTYVDWPDEERDFHVKILECWNFLRAKDQQNT